MAGIALHDRFRGAIVGAVMGNIAGIPFEFSASRDDERLRSLREGKVTESLARWRGPHDDDAAQTLLLAECIMADRGVNPGSFAHRLVKWGRTNGLGIGVQTGAVLRLLKDGLGWEAASREVWERSGFQAAGNGSLMRFAPVALFNVFSNRETLMFDSLLASRVTHWDPRCCWACVAASNFTIALAEVSPVEALRSAVESLPEEAAPVAGAIRSARDLSEHQVRSGGFVLDTLTAAVWCTIKTDNFAEAVLRAVKLAGDTDTTGCVVGAMAGFRHGLEGIPMEWRQSLAGREEGLEFLIALADGLHKIAVARR